MRKDSHLRPSIAEKGAKSTDELFLSAGRAISQWEILESYLLNLFAILTNSHHMTSVEIFGSVLSSTGRIDLLKGAANAMFINYPTRKRRMHKFFEHVSRHSGLRNDIAHGHALHIEEGCFWVPGSYQARKNDSVYGFSGDLLYRYSPTEIDAIKDTFLELTDNIRAVELLLCQWLTKVPSGTVPPHSDDKLRLSLQGYTQHKRRQS